jgi:hypothetical protein
MATTASKNSFVPDLEAVNERARETNDRLNEVVADFERKLGKQSNVEAVAAMFDTHAELSQGIVKAGVSAARELITA